MDPAEAGAFQALQELVPVGQIQNLVMRMLQHSELRVAPGWIRLARLDVLAAKQRIDLLEHCPAEGQRNRHAEHLRR